MEPTIGPVMRKEDVLAFKDGPKKVQEKYEYRILQCRARGKEGITLRLVRILGEEKWYWNELQEWWRSLCMECGCWKSTRNGSKGQCSGHREEQKCKSENCPYNARKETGLCKICTPKKILERKEAYKKSEKGKKVQKAAESNYKQSEKGKKANSNYKQSEKGKIVRSNYKQSEKGKATIRVRWKYRYDTDTNFRLKILLRGRLKKVLKDAKAKKSKRTLELLGCSTADFYLHIERQFTDEMGWHNLGKSMVADGEPYVVIDHWQPCDWFDLTKPSHQRVCFFWRNLRPLWVKDNLIKGSKVPTDITDKILLDMIASLPPKGEEEPFEEVPESDDEDGEDGVEPDEDVPEDKDAEE